MSAHTKGTARAIPDTTQVRIQAAAAGLPLADCEDSIKDKRENIANANRIVLTWNCHNELVETLERALEYVSVKGDSDAAVLERIMEAAISTAKGKS